MIGHYVTSVYWDEISFNDIENAGNNLYYFLLGEFGEYPDNETGYFGHRGLPPVIFTTPFNPNR